MSDGGNLGKLAAADGGTPSDMEWRRDVLCLHLASIGGGVLHKDVALLGSMLLRGNKIFDGTAKSSACFGARLGKFGGFDFLVGTVSME
mmetsp:Transcript_12353/g.22041  ORF Transcript_12353/g.22041 Transcript_12353/m.22041 type:complete len:89 (+) Transcript_12353:778-1044(+)